MSGASAPDGAFDRLLEQARAQLDLDADVERELLEELRGHLEESYSAARARGLSAEQALGEAGRRMGLPEAGQALQATHAGRGAADGVLAAAVPVVGTLVLRWLVLPQGDLAHLHQVLARPEFWVLALAALMLPLIRIRHWRFALASWAFFWALSLAYLIQRVVAR